MDGVLFVDGEPVADSEFSHDPQAPVKSSRISDIVARDVTVTCREIPRNMLDDAAGDPQDFLDRQLSAGQRPILIADAKEEEDLRKLSVFIAGSGNRLLSCGSAGLLGHLADRLLEIEPGGGSTAQSGRSQLHGAGNTPHSNPVLVISASMSVVTRRQIDHLIQNERTVRIVPDRRLLLSGRASNCGRHILDTLISGKHVVVDAGGSREQLPRIKTLAAGQSAAIQQFLSGLVVSIIKSPELPKLGGLIVTGGETATTVCGALDAYGIRICGEIEPLVPVGVIIGGTGSGQSIITKAGGFGTDTVLADACGYLSRLSTDLQ